MKESRCPKCGEIIEPVPVVITKSLRDRFREFRQGRLSAISAGKNPIELQEGPLTVLHLVPAGFFEDDRQIIDLESVKGAGRLTPLFSSGYNNGYSYDGYLTYDYEPPVRSYLQFLRKGRLESVDAHMIGANGDRKIIPSESFEEGIVEAAKNYMSLFQSLDMDAPLFLSLSLLGVKGYCMPPTYRYLANAKPIVKSDLLPEEITLDSYDLEPLDFMKPIFDVIWNASGLYGSPHIKDGKWIKRT